MQVVAAARLHFGCPSITGVPLQAPLAPAPASAVPAPGPGAAASPLALETPLASTVLDVQQKEGHWNPRWLQGDIMVGPLIPTRLLLLLGPAVNVRGA